MRPVLTFLALCTVLVGLLGARLYWQDAELHGPAGGAGTIEGTAVLVSSRIGARVATVAAAEGQEVAAGAVLLTLDCADAEASLAEAEARLALATAQADAAAAQASASRRAGAASSATTRAAAAQAASLSAQHDNAARQAQRLDALGSDVTMVNLDQARTQAAGLDQQLAGALASREASVHQAEAARDQSRAADAQADAAKNAVDAAQATVTRARLLAGECTLKAPAPGFVETLPWHVGELVQPGATLARIVDIREVKATFYLPNAEVAAVEPGAVATVEADAWPGETFTGKVATVSLTAAFTPRNIQTRSDRDRLVYPVEVRVPNPDGRLRPGMPVQVHLPGTGR
jgi:HlyD family secretion protein